MKKIAIFGGTGGVGKILAKLLENKYEVISLGSKDVDITNYTSVESFFNDVDVDYVLLLSVFNYDCFLHKYNNENYDFLKKQVDVNVIGTVNVLNCCLKKFREKQNGKIIVFSSILSEKPMPGTSLYSSSKSFIETLVKTASIENASKNISINTIQLGYFNAGLLEKIPEGIKQQIINKIPAKRWGNIEEIHSLVDCILENDYINGTVLKINGGL